MSQDNPAQDPTSQLNQFNIVDILKMKLPQTTDPTYIPTKFIDQFYLKTDGTFWVYINGWISIGSSNMSQTIGTTLPSATTNSGKFCYLITTDTLYRSNGTAWIDQNGGYSKPYKSFVAILNQPQFTPTPVTMNILENNLGFTPVFTREDMGLFYLSGTYPLDKTVIILGSQYCEPSTGTNMAQLGTRTVTTDHIELCLTNGGQSPQDTEDTGLINQSIEIRIYN